MTAHLHSTVVDGCYRCELGKDEMAGIRQDLEQSIVGSLYAADLDKLYIIEAVLDL